MCYAKPGPRCSSHAKRDYDNAVAERDASHSVVGFKTEAYAQFRADDNARIAAARAEGLDNRAINEASEEFYRAHPYGQAMKRSIDALDRLREAEANYDATPRGMAELRDQMAAREEAVGDEVFTDHEFAMAKNRLERGQQRRLDQMEAYKQVHQAMPWTNPKFADVDGDGVDAEAETTTPAPMCSCIEYRYQSDCTHVRERTVKARQTLLPTSHDASLQLHAANSRVRSLREKMDTLQAARGIAPRDWEGYNNLIANDPEFKALNEKMGKAVRKADAAEARFFATPQGMALLRDRIANRAPCVGNYGPHYMGGWEGIMRAATTDRENNTAQFESRTGQPAPTDDNANPPELTYSNGCPAGCNDYKWTAKCVHTDPGMASAQSMADAFSSLSEVKDMQRLMDRELNPKPRGLVSRLLGRR